MKDIIKVQGQPATLTAERARELLRYKPETGQLFWRVDRGNGVRAGDENTYCYDRYRGVAIDGRLYLAHRVIWLMVTGEWPRGEIDHVDGDCFNNQWANLRDVDRRANGRNIRRPSDNTSGCIGVTWHKQRQKWYARISTGDRVISLGLHADFQDAVAARKSAEKKYGYSDTHGRAA